MKKRRNVYIQEEHIEIWDSIPNRSRWINEKLRQKKRAQKDNGSYKSVEDAVSDAKRNGSRLK